ncbi:hypothetical protein [Marixanthomonas ophiurae]|uniref:Lipoprotein n=1 Tax=Marixanthomonas ophiurae TaxID=387659 RepID=A0A3E1QBU5_9FLAO|nr:hypothetical protein [Marixanthomonas ophiurae]RFN59586.1 hypothetical protein DZ858_05865 [Marixanthomonas ophiurae]
MKYIVISLIFIFVSCGTPNKKEKSIIEDEPSKKEVIAIEPVIPDGAVTADFNGNRTPFYSYVQKIDTTKALTTIAFENDQYPVIEIPKTYGVLLDSLKMKGVDRDLLLATVKLKDTSFNKYFLYKLQNDQWKPVVNGFAIHKSNRPDTLRPIVIDPKDSTKVIRYYSVFDMDKSSETGYTWKLLTETIPIEEE